MRLQQRLSARKRHGLAGILRGQFFYRGKGVVGSKGAAADAGGGFVAVAAGHAKYNEARLDTLRQRRVQRHTALLFRQLSGRRDRLRHVFIEKIDPSHVTILVETGKGSSIGTRVSIFSGLDFIDDLFKSKKETAYTDKQSKASFWDTLLGMGLTKARLLL